MLNVITIQGRLTRDPELRHTTNGTAVASFALAVDRDYTSKDGGEREAVHHWRWRYWRSGSRGNGAQCSGAAGYVRRRAGSRADFENGKKCIRRKKNAEKCN